MAARKAAIDHEGCLVAGAFNRDTMGVFRHIGVNYEIRRF
ncbi:hypothetical protein SAMN05216359_11479 [Roseateles sp. YR242]|nr:hypothetical protein SAMN05216359_11479 [Roseateles sp. YR242]